MRAVGGASVRDRAIRAMTTIARAIARAMIHVASVATSGCAPHLSTL